MLLQLDLYAISIPDAVYASKKVEATRPVLGDRWPLHGIASGAIIVQVDSGYKQPIRVKLRCDEPDSVIHRALDREGGWTRHGVDVT